MKLSLGQILIIIITKLCFILSVTTSAQTTENVADSSFPASKHYAAKGYIAPDSDPLVINPETVLFNNGSLIDSYSTGGGGANESILRNLSANLTTLGFGHQINSGYRVADDFEVTDPAGWHIQQLIFYAYQTGSDSLSTINAINLRIWDGVPCLPGSNIVWGDTNNNILVTSNWSGIYRVAESATGLVNRPIMANTVAVNLILPPGTYWLDWQSHGTPELSGPWTPPITVQSRITGNNGMQSTDSGFSYYAAKDDAASLQYSLPFVVIGETQSAKAIPTLSELSLLLLLLLLAWSGLHFVPQKLN